MTLIRVPGFFRKSMAFFLIVLAGMILAASQLLAKEYPDFYLTDQFGNSVHSENLKGKRWVLVGCYPQDAEICRKVGRKIYWILETLMMKKKVHIERIGYILVHTYSEAQLQRFLPEFQKEGYESIYLDKTGELESGVKPGFAYIRAFDSQGKKVVEEYRNSITTEEVKTLFSQILR